MCKKIVYVTSGYPFGKFETWATNELDSLVSLGNEIIVVPTRVGNNGLNEYVQSLKLDIRVVPIFDISALLNSIIHFIKRPDQFFRILIAIIHQSNNFSSFIKGILILPKSYKLAENLKDENIDHVHALSTTTPAVIAIILAEFLNVHWSFTLHSSSILVKKYKRRILYFMKNASMCRTVSVLTSDDLRYFVGEQFAKKIIPVHLGVKQVQCGKIKSIEESNEFVIVTPAELKAHKGHRYAISAVKQLVKGGVKNLRWIFYGDGPLKKELMEVVEDLDLMAYCSFPGLIDHQHLLDKYEGGEVDLVVSPSISIGDVFEGIPVSLMEAMSYGIPVVATDCGSTKELVDGTSGLLVSQKDSYALATAINRLMKSKDYRKSLGEGGRIKIIREFDSKHNALQLVSIFK